MDHTRISTTRTAILGMNVFTTTTRILPRRIYKPALCCTRSLRMNPIVAIFRIMRRIIIARTCLCIAIKRVNVLSTYIVRMHFPAVMLFFICTEQHCARHIQHIHDLQLRRLHLNLVDVGADRHFPLIRRDAFRLLVQRNALIRTCHIIRLQGIPLRAGSHAQQQHRSKNKRRKPLQRSMFIGHFHHCVFQHPQQPPDQPESYIYAIQIVYS